MGNQGTQTSNKNTTQIIINKNATESVAVQRFNMGLIEKYSKEIDKLEQDINMLSL